MNAPSAMHVLRPQILERRARLQAAARSVSADYLNELLAEVDAALGRIDSGTFGICEKCHDPIEVDRLQANPMIRFCLDHLSGRERHAHEQDLELAAQVQSKLLPPASAAVDGWETHYGYQPAGPVGGDYCEVTALSDNRSLFFAVGDVAGKGIAASLLMTHLSAILRSLISLNLPLEEVMSRTNHLFCESTLSAHYATLVCGRATAEGIELSNAGHCPPLVFRANGTDRLEISGLPLGLFCDVKFPVTHMTLTAGESLVLYSDGITEAQDLEGNQFGEEGLAVSLARHRSGDAQALARGVIADAARFHCGDLPADDRTLLIVRRRS